MPELKIYDLFISHAWKYGDQYDNIVSLLDNAPNFKYRDYSAPPHKPLYNLDSTDVHTTKQIEDAIVRKIRPVNIVLVISGMYYYYRRWMKFELDTALRLNKPIISINPWRANYSPKEVADIATECVNWNTNSIINAIRNNSL